jgi:N-acetylglutamate synthase-like GNAT family acetyltransferase
MIKRIHDLPLKDLEPLVTESIGEGFRFLQRLSNDWQTGVNRFDKSGEAFFGYYSNRNLIAVGGINRESSSNGRLRRFYVSQSSRKAGIGRSLVNHILAHAMEFFQEVVLHTESSSADSFYQAIGFDRISDSKDPTHRIQLKKSEPIAAANATLQAS